MHGSTNTQIFIIEGGDAWMHIQTSPQLVPPLLIRWVPKNVAPVTNHDDVINASSGESSVSPAVIGWQSPHPVTS